MTRAKPPEAAAAPALRPGPTEINDFLEVLDDVWQLTRAEVRARDRAHGLVATEVRLLKFLSACVEPVTLAAVHDALPQSTATIDFAVASLASRGLVGKARDRSRGRLVVSVTREGRALVETMGAPSRLDDAVRAMPGEELGRLTTALRSVRARLIRFAEQR